MPSTSKRHITIRVGVDPMIDMASLDNELVRYWLNRRITDSLGDVGYSVGWVSFQEEENDVA